MSETRGGAIHPCEWCRCDKVEVHDDFLQDDDGAPDTPVHQVICLGCGAAGNLAESPEAAVAAWNGKMLVIRMAATAAPVVAETIEVKGYSDGSGYKFTPAKLDDAMDRLATALRTTRKDLRDCGVGLKGGIASLAAHCAGQEKIIAELRADLEKAFDRLEAARHAMPSRDERPAEWPDDYDGCDWPTSTDFLNG